MTLYNFVVLFVAADAITTPTQSTPSVCIVTSKHPDVYTKLNCHCKYLRVALQHVEGAHLEQAHDDLVHPAHRGQLYGPLPSLACPQSERRGHG